MAHLPIVYFVSIDYLKNSTPISQSVEDNIIQPFIVQAQDTFLQQGLGETLFDRLKNGIVNNDLNEDEEYLLKQFIQPLVAQYTFYLVLPFINYKLTNKSVSKERSEFSDPVEIGELKFIRSSVLDIAEFYKKRMVKYLCDHSTKYPQYINQDVKSNLRRTKQSYFNGIYLGGVKKTNNIPTWDEPYNC